MSESIGAIKINSRVQALERYKKYLEVSSVFMKNPLTKLEIKFMDELFNNSGGIITTESRKTVRENLNISAEQLNNYIRGLRKKGVIIDDNISPHFLIDIPESETFSISVNCKVVT
jgi:chaperonin cofactor prefoldin